MRTSLKIDDQKNPQRWLGIDGCRGGWICAVLEDSGVKIRRLQTVDAAIDDFGDCTCLLIDIPIGLQSNPSQMRPDDAARKYLGVRASTIFPVPCRQAVYAASVSDAYDINEKVMGRKFTPLTVGIIPKIREVDVFLQQQQGYKNKLLESHPEICFAQLAGRTLLTRKNTPEGQDERISTLRNYADITAAGVRPLAKQLSCSIDDITDAVCLAVAARFVSEGHFRTLPENPETDDTGLLMQMVIPVVPTE